jgi:Astacin (Peptidase family M12A)
MRRPAPTMTAQLFLPGMRGAHPVQLQVVDGMAIHQGDILLGHVSQLALRYGRPPAAASASPAVSYATAVADNDDLWPGGVMPYVIDPSIAAKDHPKLQAAIERLNQTALNLRPATSADTDFVRFVDHGKGCYSFYGRVGGGQDCHVGGCSTSTMMHEVLHAAGFYHEHARPDRDQFIEVVWSEIVEGEKSNFQLQEGARTFGGYDFGSIMHYNPQSYSKSGKKTLVAKVPGVKVGGANDLTPKDVAGIAELYGGAPPQTQPPPPQTQPPAKPPTWAELLGLPPNPQGVPAWPTIPGLGVQGLPAGLPPWPVLSTTPAPPGLPPIPHVFW